MKEKELRIALVCFGGVSLAVYMHGISKEILKLVRASSRLHDVKDRAARARSSFYDSASRDDPEYDTDEIYYDLLREIGKTCELRVLVDVVAGASAGGINGAMLARALAHDLPMGGLRDLWLDHADVTDLLDPEARAGARSKLLLAPLVWLFGATGVFEQVQNPEVRAKLSLFVRSRWFKPPLSGLRMSELMYKAITAMGEPRTPTASLLPSGLGLDLFVTVTDHHGYQQLVEIHDPPLIHEREHRHVLRFSYRRSNRSGVRSDFDTDHAPALAFAARATSSFPGVFPPAQIGEMDAFLAGSGLDWPGRRDFIEANFAAYQRLNVDPVTACFLDGSVLNNRPFRAAINAIRGRPAFRQVDRRLVYIEPDPAPPTAASHHAVPGFFATLKAALSDLPSAEPVADELNWVRDFNEHVERLRAIVEDARPQVTRLVAEVLPVPLPDRIEPAQLRAWREGVNARVSQDAGFAYEGYVRLKLHAVRGFVASVVAGLRGVPARSPLGHAISATIDAWAQDAGVTDRTGRHAAVHLEGLGATRAPRWVRFLLAFDVEYRRRRLHFLIEAQNQLYQSFDDPAFAGYDRAVVDALKRALYACMERLAGSEDASRLPGRLRDLAETIFPVAPAPDDAGDLAAFAARTVSRHRERLEALVDGLSEAIQLDASTTELDELLANLDAGQWNPGARLAVLTQYLGFPFWDLLTFPVMTSRGSGEFNRILIDRISPQDARTLPGFSGVGSLKGTGFAHFAAFFSRAYRENDYLLGRIHGIDRLIDIVCDSAGLGAEQQALVLGLKKRAFARVIEAEEAHLPGIGEVLAALRAEIAALPG